MMLALLALWTLQTLLFGTAAMALQSVSRARLGAALKSGARERQLARFDRHFQAYALAAQLLHHAGVVCFVLTIALMLPATKPWYLRPLQGVAGSAAWVLLFGVAIPSAWSRYAGEHVLSSLSGLLEVLRVAGWPMFHLLRGVDEIIRRLAGVPREEAEQTAQIERQILDVVSHADVEGPVDESEKAMIRSVMTMDDTSVGQIMTPRTDMVGIEVSSPWEEVREAVRMAGHSRTPVYEETMDHVVGILYAKDLLGVADPAGFSLRQIMRSVFFVPETKDVASLLREFQANRVHIAIVLDEYGGTAGLVTIEDVLEELVGEIVDEHDEPAAARIHRIDAQTAEVDARVRVEELNAALGLSLPEDDAYDTIAGYVFSRMGRIPRAGETLADGALRLEVVSATDRTLGRVRIHQPPAVESAA
jgi:CBS domain containing-hemolysin-like protein